MRFILRILIFVGVVGAYLIFRGPQREREGTAGKATPPGKKPKTYRPVKSEVRFYLTADPAASGEIEIGNGNDQPALVKIISLFINRKACMAVILPKSSFKISRVPAGKYDLEYALGDEIITGTDRFWQPTALGKFAEPLEVHGYQRISVTLHAVKDGNAKIVTIPESQFDRD
jgi:hypothetical protein